MLDSFDLVVQISKKKFLSYILEHVLIHNLPIVPKFTFKVLGQNGTMTAILDGVDLYLSVGKNEVTLVYHVYAATVTLPNKSQLGFSEGEINIRLKITPGAPFRVIMQMARFRTSQTSQIADTTAFFKDVANLITASLDTKTEWDLFPNTPSATALIMLGLSFNGQIFCLDKDTIAGVIGTGDIKKVTNFLKKQDFGVGLSAAGVKNNILFPAMVNLLNPQDVANLLNISLDDAVKSIQNPTVNFLNSIKPLLPAPFGSGEIKQSQSGVDIFFTFIDFQLQNGSIKMTGRLRGEGFCTHISNGIFEELVTLSIIQQKVLATFSPNPPKPTYSVNFDFWCALGFFLLAGYIIGVIGIVIVIIVIAVVTSLTVEQKKLSQNPFSAPAFDQVTWLILDILTEGLILLGKSSAAVDFNTSISRVDIDSTITPTNIEEIGSGTYHFPGNLVCKAQDFQYKEYRQDIEIYLSPKATGLLFPVKTTWIVRNQAITSGSGQISFTDLAHTATPPFNETALPNHKITIDFALNPGKNISIYYDGLDTLRLICPKSDYNFGLFVELQVQDASGRIYSSPFSIEVETNVVQFGQDFLDFQKQCALATKIKLTKIKTIPKKVLHGGYPLTNEVVTNIVKEVIAQNPKEAIDLVKNLANTHGVTAVIKTFAPKTIK
ncbi:MAG: hypothetical protein AAB567_00305 [Patescibacteria group bacterium]